ncbi:MAG: DUF6000 family protein [Candidatus Kapaibacterium sp.]|jgi:hypothetical protein
MEDLNKMARLHSAGATVRHISPFESLPSYKNNEDLSADFIKKWVVPFYMKINSYDSLDWVDQIKEINSEITRDVCLTLLCDFNWRTRLVGSYFAAVKDYRDLIDIIGTHLLKSEVCCVGHIYALTLAFFNDERCIQYLNQYLDYYLTKPSLYFDQEDVMEAVLHLDRENKSDYFSGHLENWKIFQKERQTIKKNQVKEVEKTLEHQEGCTDLEDYLKDIQSSEVNEKVFSTENFDKKITTLRDLNQYCRKHR